jgi:amino acid transporter
MACLFLFDNAVSLFTGAVFVFAGVFLASVVIAMPFYFYKKKHLNRYYLLSIIELLATIFLTVICFLYFFANPTELKTIASSIDYDSAYIVQCDEPIPEFTLSLNLIPNKTQTDAFCSCIWKKLSPSDKNLSASLTRDELHDDSSDEKVRQFLFMADTLVDSCKSEII